jgi:type VI secretion system protein ImpH
MAGEDRTTPDAVDLFQDLHREPYTYGFFHALRLLECHYSNKPRIGESARPIDDPVRFGQEASMAFAPSTLSEFKYSSKGFPPRLSVLFFGLFGPNGPLPLHLTEYARERLRNVEDPTFSRFADVFHHRLLSLFYRAWADARPTTSLDRPEDDYFSNFVGSLIGIGARSLRHRDAFPDFAKLYYSGRLACQRRNAEGLQAILSDYFEMPSRVEQFSGEWLDMPVNSQMRLGESEQTCLLGQTTTLGSRVWECQHKFRVSFGPLSMVDYQRILPGGESLTALIAIVRSYTGDEFNWDVHLILEKDEAQPAKLGEFGQLGWTTWMSEEKPDRNPDQLYFNPMLEVID